ncbi:transcriptional regulator [Acidihalobacter yilgarnensis]|uniref:Transcriptional regulator n=1 Tax=Acidihalobacter yilgarnensis TaxID=2819280 RepID=A0A1D8IK68_9GAMM|nr:LysR family transcriptional regulator [Acidihalobacter yilgarnensis]AOU96856.1 transcriptional regulator [Acidihalobacter yilgarnensis]
MNFTFRQLKTFEAVARQLSFTRAAEELFLTQPAVSMQVRQLEENIGLPLFEHLGRRIDLTDAGRVLHGFVQRINEVVAEADEVLEGMKGLRRGQLRISVASTANHFATRLLADFSRQYPEVSISLDVTNRETLLKQLSNNETDIVIMGEPPSDMDLEAEAFMENPLVAIAAPEHPLVGEVSIPLARLAQERFVLREQGSGTRGAIARFFEQHGQQLRTGMEMSSNEAIKHAVEAGLGLGIVSLHTLELELEAARIVVLKADGFPILRDWYMVHRRGKRNTPVTQAFHDYVLAEAAQHVRLPRTHMAATT